LRLRTWKTVFAAAFTVQAIGRLCGILAITPQISRS